MLYACHREYFLIFIFALHPQNEASRILPEAPKFKLSKILMLFFVLLADV